MLQKRKFYYSEASNGCFHPLTTESDYHLISPKNITPESHIKATRVKEMITKLLIVEQILLISTLANTLRTIWRIQMLMLGCKGSTLFNRSTVELRTNIIQIN